MKDKQSYLALIFDLVRTPQYEMHPFLDEKKVQSKTKKKFLYFNREYLNKRWGLYCSCGHMTEVPLNEISKDDYGKLILQKSLICKNCNKTYKSLSEVKIIYSKNPTGNVTSKRFGVVEKDNFYALYSFATIVFVSVTTKKLIFKDVGNHSLYFYKNSDTIRIRKNDKIITVPFKFLVKRCSAVINNMMQNALCENIIPQGIFERQVINPLIKFCEIIESKCDKRDVDKILSILKKERDDFYNKTLFRELSQYPSDSFQFYSNNCYYDIKSMDNYKGDMSTYRYAWIQYIKRRLCIMLSISVYPPLVTLVLKYGPDKFLNLFSNSSLMCSLTSLKKKKPTNPKEILETMFKSKIISEFSKNTKIIKYVKTEEKKRKRKLKAHPENRNFLNRITTNPVEYVDSRVPVFKNVKLKLKQIQFRKFYVDLFVENFDEIAKVFYDFLNDQSIFDEISTMDKIILNNKTENTCDLIIGLQSIYEQNRYRFGNFKMNYDFFCHILKMANFEQSININWSRIIQIYADTIFMLIAMEISLLDIFKAKTIKALEDMHNSLSQSYQLVQNEKLNEELKLHIEQFRHTEGVFENIKFQLIDTPERFFEESSIMNHCVKTYCTSVAQGHYVIYSIEDITTGDRATLSISIQGTLTSSDGSKITTYTFNQLKAKNNAKSTEIIINSVKDFIDKFFKIQDYSRCNDLELEDFKRKKELELEDAILALNNLVNQEQGF